MKPLRWFSPAPRATIREMYTASRRAAGLTIPVPGSDGVTSTRNGSGMSAPDRNSAQDTAHQHINRYHDDDTCKDAVECPSPFPERPRDAATDQSADDTSGDEDGGETPVDQSRSCVVERGGRPERGDRDERGPDGI